MDNICAVRLILEGQELEKPDFKLKKLPHEPVPSSSAEMLALENSAGLHVCKHCASFYQE